MDLLAKSGVRREIKRLQGTISLAADWNFHVFNSADLNNNCLTNIVWDKTHSRRKSN
jgi:hypothetical protein